MNFNGKQLNGEDKKRIVFFTHYSGLYGANRSLLNLIQGLSFFSDLEFLLIVPEDGEVVVKAMELNIDVLIIPFFSSINFRSAEINLFYLPKYIVKILFNWYLVLKFSAKIKSYHPVLIHTNTSVTFIGAYFSFWLKLPHVWHLREFGKIDYNFTYDLGIRAFYYWLNKAYASIAISKSIYNARLFNAIAKVRKLIIYNGVISLNELVDVNKEAESHTYESQFVFAIIGLLSASKNQIEAIEAFNLLHKEYTEVKLLIVGDGDHEYFLKAKQLTELYNLGDKVTFTGYISDTQIIYNKIDMLLMCSRNEALGRVTLEALSHGIPVIGYNNAGTTEIIKDSYNGFLYLNDYHELFEKMKVSVRDRILIKAMKNNCIETVRKHFTIEQCARDVYQVYKMD